MSLHEPISRKPIRERELGDPRSRFLFWSSSLAFTIGLGLTIRRTLRKAPPVPFFTRNLVRDTDFSPALHAVKALGAGTLLCLTGATILIGTIRVSLGVGNMKEFADKMRLIMKKTSPAMIVRSSDESKEEVGPEWSALWEEGRRLDESRALEKAAKKREREKAKQERTKGRLETSNDTT